MPAVPAAAKFMFNLDYPENPVRIWPHISASGLPNLCTGEAKYNWPHLNLEKLPNEQFPVFL